MGTEKEKFRSGFVTIAGRPNAGKSTLLNVLLGRKLAIVADKPQTTRTTIQGALNLPGAQIVFIDTPGIHRSDSAFNRRMMKTVRAALESPDLVLFVADATLPFSPADAEALDAARKAGAPLILLLNKTDRVRDKNTLLPLIEQYSGAGEFAEIIPISAVTADGVDALRKAIVERLPEAPPMFPRNFVTDQPERFLAGEIVREKILRSTHEEVPHSVAVLVDKWEDKPRLLKIFASIYVEKPGQKGIVIGARGALLKQIGTDARQEIEELVGKRVYLELFVKVRPQWRQSEEFLNEIDWRSMTGVELETAEE